MDSRSMICTSRLVLSCLALPSWIGTPHSPTDTVHNLQLCLGNTTSCLVLTYLALCCIVSTYAVLSRLKLPCLVLPSSHPSHLQYGDERGLIARQTLTPTSTPTPTPTPKLGSKITLTLRGWHLVQGSGFQGFRVQGSGFRVHGSS